MCQQLQFACARLFQDVVDIGRQINQCHIIDRRVPVLCFSPTVMQVASAEVIASAVVHPHVKPCDTFALREIETGHCPAFLFW
jgi:hypothetical protein